jgi:hypothetical protein
MIDHHRVGRGGPVVFVGRFYGQPEFGKTDMSKIGVEALLALLRSSRPGMSEISCHPGYLQPRRTPSTTGSARPSCASLTDERVKAAIVDEGIRLINCGDYSGLRS